MTIREFAVLLTVWFSIPNRMGLGAVPLGALLLPAYLRLKIFEWLLFASCTLIVISNVRSVTDLWTAMTLMIGIVVFFSFLSSSVQISRKVFWVIVCALLLEAVYGGVVAASDTRSASLITQEPSHAARIFFIVMIAFVRAHKLELKKNLSLAVLGGLYVMLNKSSSAFLMYIVFLTVTLASIEVNRKKFLASLAIVVALVYSLFIASPDSRFVSHIQQVAGASSATQSPSQLMHLGSRRFQQSIGGYAAGGLWGRGYSSGQAEFLAHSYQAGVNLYDNSTIEEVAEGPSSYFSELVYKAGWLRAGSVLTLILIAVLARREKGLSWTLLFASLVQILFFSTTTIPTPWIMLALTPDKRME